MATATISWLPCTGTRWLKSCPAIAPAPSSNSDNGLVRLRLIHTPALMAMTPTTMATTVTSGAKSVRRWLSKYSTTSGGGGFSESRLPLLVRRTVNVMARTATTTTAVNSKLRRIQRRFMCWQSIDIQRRTRCGYKWDCAGLARSFAVNCECGCQAFVPALHSRAPFLCGSNRYE